MVISDKSISQPVIRPSTGPAINAQAYQRECSPIVEKFVRTYHKDGEYVYWPDLASSHYAATTQNWLKEKNINFVAKEANPPNIPKARPIEDFCHFWSILSRLVYCEGREAKSVKQLQTRIKKQIKNVSLDVVQNMMAKVKSKLRKTEEGGPFAIL